MDNYSEVDGYFQSGNVSLLNEAPIAIYSSQKIPLSIYQEAIELIARLSNKGVVLAGGWQSPLERKMLKVVTQVEQGKVIYFLAKGIKYFNPWKYLRPLIQSQRLLVVSPFENEERITSEMVKERDELILRLIDTFLFIFVNPSGKTPRFVENCLKNNKRVYFVDHPQNKDVLQEGIGLLSKYNYQEVLKA